jgi:pimeloyl-ACP methyl ester carboxylesterase
MWPIKYLRTPLLVAAMLLHGHGAGADPASLRLPAGSDIRAAIEQLPPAQKSVMEAAAAETFPLFILVPGIMGSRLTKTLPNGKTAVIWGRTDGVFSKPDRLLLYDEADQVTAEPLEDYYVFNQAFDVYGRAVAKLSFLDLSAGNSVRKFGYDWRQPNALSAKKFAAWMCDNKAEFATRPLVLIAHSMGGLVVKSWLKDIYDSSGCAPGDTFANWAKIKRIVFVGTPHYGAPKAITAFADNYSLFVDRDDTTLNAVLGFADSATFSKSLNAFGATFPSAYELLPIVNTNKCFADPKWPSQVFVKSINGGMSSQIDLFDPGTWKLLRWPKAIDPSIDRTAFVDKQLPKLLSSARDFACGISHYRPEQKFDVVWLSGMRRKTICEVTINQPTTLNEPATIDTKMCDDGDGTVPKWIASERMYSTANTSRSTGEGHLHLVGSDEFMDYLDDYRDELHREMQRKFAAKTGNNVDGLVTLYASLHAAVPSVGGDPSDVTVRTTQGVLAALNVQPDDLLATAMTDKDPLARVSAYRLFADVAEKGDQRRAWAFNNSAHIYLNRNDSVSAFSFGKRALAAGAASNAGTILMRKSGSISAYAAEQLGELDSAKSLRDLSAGKVDYFTIQGKI